jgi:hypothetical protein
MQVGHAGTLDPMATGLLIICTGRGTKAIDGFVAMEKAYSGTLRLGQATPSYDAETDVSSEQPWEHITGDKLADTARPESCESPSASLLLYHQHSTIQWPACQWRQSWDNAVGCLVEHVMIQKFRGGAS